METWIYSIVAAAAVSLLSLIGGLGLLLPEAFLKKAVSVLVGLAVGVLLADAFVHLLPEAVELTQAPRAVSILVLAGVLAFFAMEKIVKWRHSHSLAPSGHGPDVKSYAPMCLIGDAVHNFVDGAIIASSFLVSPAVGFATAVAIVAHEIPQEISDVAILVHGGYRTRRALWLNFLCSLTVLPGVVGTLLFSMSFGASMVYLLPIAAGGFIYIAASDLIPQLHEEPARELQWAQGLAIVSGVFFILGASVLESHLDRVTRRNDRPAIIVTPAAQPLSAL